MNMLEFLRDLRWFPYADAAWLLVLPETAGAEAVFSLHRLLRRARAEGELDGILDLVPAMRTLGVFIDAERTDLMMVRERIEAVLASADGEPDAVQAQGRRWRIPICYGDAGPEFGPDLEEVARRLGMSPEAVVRTHAGGSYRVEAIGFLPGFAYMGGLPDALRLPRRETPRTQVPPGSLAMADAYTAIYPAASPGGWHLLGRCPLPLFSLAWSPPGLFAPGDEIRFEPIDAATFASLATRYGGEVPPWPEEFCADGTPAEVRATAVEPPSVEGVRLVWERVAPGTTLQDRGRFGWRHLGVSTAGALAPSWLELAAALVGNPAGSAAFEMSLPGSVLRAEGGDLTVGLAGMARVRVEGPEGARPARWLRHEGITLAAGERLVIERLGATRAVYLAVAGLQAPVVLGSAASDRWLGWGTITPGSVFAVYGEGTPGRLVAPDPLLEELEGEEPLVLRFVWGPQVERFPEAARTTWTSGEFSVTERSDRMGTRLEGPALRAQTPAAHGIVSEPSMAGCVQVPADGQPIVLLRDAQTIGGYAKIATVIEPDLERLALALPGRRLRFTAVEVEEALFLRRAWRGEWEALCRQVNRGSLELLSSERLLELNLIDGVCDARDQRECGLR